MDGTWSRCPVQSGPPAGGRAPHCLRSSILGDLAPRGAWLGNYTVCPSVPLLPEPWEYLELGESRSTGRASPPLTTARFPSHVHTLHSSRVDTVPSAHTSSLPHCLSGATPKLRPLSLASVWSTAPTTTATATATARRPARQPPPLSTSLDLAPDIHHAAPDDG